MFYDGIEDLGRVVAVGSLAYAALVLMLRVSGKRTLSKMNAFDMIVTIALGSTLSAVLLSKDVALAEGLAAFATLICLQLAITWLSVRSKTVRNLVKSEPALLVYRGRILDDAMRRERVTTDELQAAVRAHGGARIADLRAVVIETDGSFSIVTAEGDAAADALEGVIGYEDRRPEP